MNPKNQLMLNWHISCLMLYQRVLFARMQMRTDRLKKNDQMGHKLTARSRIGIPARIFLYFFLPWGDTRILFAQLGSWELGVKFAVWQATLTAWQDSETCSLNHWTFYSVSSHQKVHNIYYYMYHYTTEPPLNAMWQMNVKECWGNGNSCFTVRNICIGKIAHKWPAHKWLWEINYMTFVCMYVTAVCRHLHCHQVHKSKSLECAVIKASNKSIIACGLFVVTRF